MTSNQLNDKPQVKFVYFDIGNVFLYHSHVSGVIAEKYGLDAKEVENFFYEHIDWLCTDKMSIEEYSKKAAKELNINDPEFNWVETNNALLRPIPEAHALAGKVAQVLPIGILSDAWRGIEDVLIDRELIPKLAYQAEIYSYQYNSIKPEDKLMSIAEEKAGVSPENILFTDDRAGNLAGAKERGWQTILFDPDQPAKSVATIEEHLQKSGIHLK